MEKFKYSEFTEKQLEDSWPIRWSSVIMVIVVMISMISGPSNTSVLVSTMAVVARAYGGFMWTNGYRFARRHDNVPMEDGD